MAIATTTSQIEASRAASPEDIPMQQHSAGSADGRVEEQVEASNAIPAVTTIELTPLVRLKVLSAAFAFFNTGVNDGSLGALIPYILRDYSITTAWMALPYGVAFFGWLLTAIFGGYLRVSFGTGGYMIAGATLQLLAQVLRFWKPPFGLFSASFFFMALGQAFQDSQANTFVASIKKAHRWLGVIHGSYALGCCVGPIMGAAIASNFHDGWAKFYYIPTGTFGANLILCMYAFRDETTLYQRIRRGRQGVSTTTRRSTAALVELMATVKQKPIWLLSTFYFVYLGAAITAGGWVVEFLHVVRKGDLSRVGYISSAFYGGTALGRLALAEPTFRFGEKRMLLLYGVLSLALEIVFWRVANIIVDAVMISLIGVLLGPFFATGVSVGSQLIPQELQSSGLSMIFVVAQAGGALFPAITGVISARAGVGTLQPILVGLLAATIVAWFLVPDPKKKNVSS